MVLKVLKVELCFLFLLTVLSFLAYYSDNLPDNYFYITAARPFSNWLVYYLTSALVFLEYLSGPWIFFPFFIFCFFYSFVYSKREYKLDFLNIFPLSISLLLITYLTCPVLLGKGLLFSLQSLLPDWIWILITPVMVVLFLLLSFRQKFLEKSKELINKINDIPNIARSYLTKTREKIKNMGKIKPLNFPNLKLPEKLMVSKLSKNKEPVGNYFAGKENLQFDEIRYYQIMDSVAKERTKEKIDSPKEEYFENIISSIEKKLAEFKISGEIINVLKGPVVDTFELVLGPGIKVSKLINHSQDLSLALLGVPIRIVYPMKGRTTVGIEVPRSPRQIIFLDEILHSKEFKNIKLALPLCMGKDAFGEVFVCDLANMPHMLVAGSTGAGKSVFINSILFSLLIKKTPEQLRLILIDPKQLELALYSHLPHLAMPVITEASMGALALRWACLEMERRYSILKEFGVRNIDGFNEKLLNAPENLLDQIKPYYGDEEKSYNLPFLVIIIDEFADLILSRVGREIENNVCRIAAKARAAGIHLVLATQRPSVDVITGLIKSNFPTRVSFKVASSIDSRTILNNMGAEFLLGKGDMLYKAGIETLRIHGAYVAEKEIEDLVFKLREFKKSFDPEVLGFLGQNKKDFSQGTLGRGSDYLFNDAVQVVLEYKSASASMLQRRLKIGYNRAANLIEEMEAKGIVGPADGSKPRKVLSKAEGFTS